jgi:hypothetical protein
VTVNRDSPVAQVVERTSCALLRSEKSGNKPRLEARGQPRQRPTAAIRGLGLQQRTVAARLANADATLSKTVVGASVGPGHLSDETQPTIASAYFFASEDEEAEKPEAPLHHAGNASKHSTSDTQTFQGRLGKCRMVDARWPCARQPAYPVERLRYRDTNGDARNVRRQGPS